MEVINGMSEIKEKKSIIKADKDIQDDDRIYCDRNLCFSMEINGLGCEDCPVYKQGN